MKLPYMKPITNKVKLAPLMFQGLNKNILINDGELSEGENLSSEHLPALAPVKPREVIEDTIEDPQSIFYGYEGLCYVDGTDFVYEGIMKGSVTTGPKSMVDFNGNIVIFPDKKYYNYKNDTFGSFSAPDLDYITVHDNRIWGVKGQNIRGTANGNFKEWEDFSGDELDSWATDVYSEGDFTGIATYQNHVILFKDDYAYELYGAKPSQFSVQDVSKYGCIDHRTIREVNGKLFFVSKNGPCIYGGGVPRPIGESLNETYEGDVRAIGDGRYYHMYVNGRTYTFDTYKNVWMPDSKINIIDFTSKDKIIYALTDDGKIIKYNSGTTKVKWQAVTKNYDDQSFQKKTTRKIRLKAHMEPGAKLKIYTSYDERPFILAKTIIESPRERRSVRDIRIELPIKRTERFQLKFEGEGDIKIYGEREFYVRGEK